jgi:hypothetical protein
MGTAFCAAHNTRLRFLRQAVLRLAQGCLYANEGRLRYVGATATRSDIKERDPDRSGKRYTAKT